MDQLSIKKEQADAKRLVKECLEEDQRCRNSDLWLLLRFWQKKQQIKVFIPFEKISEMIAAETITRCRRKIQNDDKELLPTDPRVLIRRKFKEEVLRDYYSNNQRLLQEYTDIKYGVQ